MSTDIEKYQQSAVFEIEEVVHQKATINKVFKEVMKEDVHYGKIPGTQKPSLFKAGAELISFMYRLSASYETEYRDIGENGHREVVSTCTLTHIPTGQIWGQYTGSCSTMEGKYRFRTGNVNVTDKPVPQPYWDLRKKDPKAALKMIGGPGHSTKKIDGTWMIVEAGEKCEHDNPADYHNTVLKMAQKRAFNSANIACTAASDIFTVDVEDMPEVIDGAQGHEEKPSDVVDVTPEDPPDTSEEDWKREEARLNAEAAGKAPAKNEYEDKPPPASLKIDKGKAKVLYAKWKNIPDYSDEEKDELMKEWGVESWYAIDAVEFEKYKTLLDAFYKKK